MKHLIFELSSCSDIIEVFGENKVQQRYDTLFEEVNTFIQTNQLQASVRLDRITLANVIVDYFSDIKRLKNFHDRIDKTNSEKVIAYTSYWFLKRKPIQIVVDNEDFTGKLATINERFVLQYILNYLSERERQSHILLRANIGLKNFAKYLLYYLIYRLRDAQSLEMIITSFMAGQIYENLDRDISAELHPYDNGAEN